MMLIISHVLQAFVQGNDFLNITFLFLSGATVAQNLFSKHIFQIAN